MQSRFRASQDIIPVFDTRRPMNPEAQGICGILDNGRIPFSICIPMRDAHDLRSLRQFLTSLGD
jgi:hypothetical protein